MEAIGLAAHHHPDLLLLDLSMPAMDGLEALAGVLAVSPATRVVVFSGFEEGGIAQVALQMGAAAFIEKSVPIDLLADRVVAVLPESAAQRPAGQRPESQRPGRGGLSLLGQVRPDDGGSTTHDGDQRILNEHLESFREVFEEAAIGMATMTLSGTLVRANAAMADLMQCDPSDLIGVDYGRLTSGRGDTLDAALDDIAHEVSDLASFEHDIAGWPEPRQARASLAAVRDSKGRPLYVFLQVQDITAQAAAEEQLRQSEERFRLLIEAVQEYAIFMLDPDGLVTSWNLGAERTKGYQAAEIIGTHFRVFYPPEQQAAAHPEHELELALRDGRYEEEGWRVRKDGSRFWASVLITAVFDESGTHIGFAKVTRDTTERRRAEQERGASNQALADANAGLEDLAARLRQSAEDQSRFLETTAHELRSPLMVLGGSASTLSQHWDRLADQDRLTLLDGMTASAQRLQRLVTDLLTASKLDANTLDIVVTRVRLADVLHSTLALLRTGDASDLVVSIDDDIYVVADPDRLAQAVDNLVRNALTHGAPPVHIDADRVSGTVRLRVSDAGDGVDPALRPRLFERFATGGRDGTGLGLYIARELVRAQGGDAFYDDEHRDDAAGSFVLTIPSAV